MPLEHLSAVSLFANAIEELVTDKTVTEAGLVDNCNVLAQEFAVGPASMHGWQRP